MVSNFLTVGQQVLVLFLIIAVGFFCGKRRIISKEAARSIADIVLLFATPCVIIRSFERTVSAELLKGLGIAALSAIGVHAVGILLSHLLIRDKVEARKQVLRFGAVFSNAGYMAIPLQYALLGDDGVFYGAVYVAVFNLFLWTYGVAIMGEGKKSLSVRKVLINPGVIGVVIGLVILFSGFPLPEVLASPIDHIANLNTPLPMLVIGYYLAGADVKSALKDRSCYLSIALRLIIIPLIALGVLWVCGVRGTVMVSAVIGASAPIATATTMFATRYERDAVLSVNLVVLSTLLSIVTMPLIVGLAGFLA